LSPYLHCWVGCTDNEVNRVDRDREGPYPHWAILEAQHGVGARGTDEASSEPGEVRRRTGHLKAHEIGAEKTLDDVPSPRQLHEQLLRRKRDVQEEANAKVGSQCP